MAMVWATRVSECTRTAASPPEGSRRIAACCPIRLFPRSAGSVQLPHSAVCEAFYDRGDGL
ncbi:hypothetical protein BGK67_00690 [Streptomyces subrutilus]|uniref:Uncharacterized protein n=1 Tax=Streptomyces subrutilus TaxID=36818 RepID=A0A1E5PKL7_9ACTN|nr:hypothetical protein BGK67_00690 [Streptomyces subrutilus]